MLSTLALAGWQASKILNMHRFLDFLDFCVWIERKLLRAQLFAPDSEIGWEFLGSPVKQQDIALEARRLDVDL